MINFKHMVPRGEGWNALGLLAEAVVLVTCSGLFILVRLGSSV